MAYELDTPPGAGTSTTSIYGRTITRQSLIYAVGLGAVVPFGLVSLALTTRYLEPADYGHLAVMFTIASLLPSSAASASCRA